MKKLIALLFAGAISMAGFAFSGASAEDSCLSDSGVDNGIVDACGAENGDGTGHGKIDGNDENPSPLGGYISYSNDGQYEQDGELCISDQGDPEPEEDEDGNDTNPDDNGACDDDIPEAVVAFVTG